MRARRCRATIARPVVWLKKAAAQDDPDAESLLGAMYADGSGIPKDDGQAFALLSKAADHGDGEAQARLGGMYGMGRGAPRDYVQAHLWLSLAAERLPASEAGKRTLAAQARDMISVAMAPDELAQAQRLERDWKPK